MRKFIIYIFILLVSCTEANKKTGLHSISKKTPFLILNKNGAMGEYTGELLKAEGFNEFDILNIDNDSFTLAALQSYDWVILPKMEVPVSGLNEIVNYIKTGGNLVSFLPSAELLLLLKAGTVADTLRDGYIRIDTAAEIGRGLLSNPLKFHGEALLVNNLHAQFVAGFQPRNAAEPVWPAVIFQDIEMGHALCFLYDLPKNILVTRQGNPAFADREMDGIPGLRATDLFTNHWVDTAMNCLNPADEQLRLLTHSIEVLSHNKKPLPRFWYFPDTLTCLATLTNDGEERAEKDFVQQLKDVSAKGAKMSLYILAPEKLSRRFVDSLISEGFEIAAHPDAVRYADRPSWAAMTKAIRDKQAALNATHGISRFLTNANHWFVWCGADSINDPDFAAQAKIESNLGIRLDVNYAHYDNMSNQSHFLGAFGERQGNFEGSGLPVRFGDVHGNVIDIFQHFNNVYDQQYMDHQDSVGFFENFKGLVDRSMDEEVYSYISIKSHNDEYFFSKNPLMQMLDYANRRQVPVWTAARLYKFLKVKDEARFSDFNFIRGTLIFTVYSMLDNPSNLSFLVPFNFNGKSISRIIGNEISYPVRKKKIKGIDYAWVSISPGKLYGFRVSYKEPGETPAAEREYGP